MHIFAVQGESDKESYLCKRCYRTAVAGAAMEHSNSLRLIGATWSQCSVSRVCEASLCGRIPDAGLQRQVTVLTSTNDKSEVIREGETYDAQ